MTIPTLNKKTSCFLFGLHAFSSIFMGIVLGAGYMPQSSDLHQRPVLSPNYMNNVASKINDIEYLQNEEFIAQMESVFLELHQVGFYNFITNFLNQDKRDKVSGYSLEADFQEQRSSSDRTQDVRDFMQQLVDNRTISPVCANDTGRMIIAIVEMQPWIVPFVDSMGKPGPSLTKDRLTFVGNYKQCRSSVAPLDPVERSGGFQGNYCDLVAALQPPLGISLGACVPDTCSEEDLRQMVDGVLDMANMTAPYTPMAHCHTDEREVTTATVAAIVFLSVIALLMLLGTTYDLLVVQRPQWYGVKDTVEDFMFTTPENQSVPQTKGEHIFNEESQVTPLVPKSVEPSVIVNVLLAFSVYTNAKKVLNTKQAPGSLTAIHGIRFLSMSWVILAHVYAMLNGVSVNLIENYPVFLKRWTFNVVSNGFSSVDTFFTLSGLLTSYLTIREMMRKSWKINWALFYFHRVWRLTPPYMLALLIILGLQRFFGSGALWSNTQPMDKAFCEKNWWTNLLYINNIVRPKELCFAQSWYLANDMQFFVISPLMIIPFYFHRLAGLASCSVCLLATMITTGALSTHNEWPTDMISMKPTAATATWFTDYYITPWCRIGPFIIGIMAGYVLAVTNGGRLLRMKWWMVVLGWLVAVASGLAVVYGLHNDIRGEDVSSVGVAAFYNAVSRSVWGACVSWVIVACAAGYGGPVNALLSWSPFVFLGKLTYMAYLIHPSIVYSYYANRDNLLYISDANMVITYLGLLFFVNMMAFVAMLALESPMIGLEKAFIRKKSRD